MGGSICSNERKLVCTTMEFRCGALTICHSADLSFRVLHTQQQRGLGKKNSGVTPLARAKVPRRTSGRPSKGPEERGAAFAKNWGHTILNPKGVWAATEYGQSPIKGRAQWGKLTTVNRQAATGGWGRPLQNLKEKITETFSKVRIRLHAALHEGSQKSQVRTRRSRNKAENKGEKKQHLLKTIVTKGPRLAPSASLYCTESRGETSQGSRRGDRLANCSE